MAKEGTFEKGYHKCVRMSQGSQEVTGRLLEKVIEYLYYRHRWTDAKGAIPEFPLDEDIVLDLLQVATYLGLGSEMGRN